MKKLQTVQALRAIAALVVVLFHSALILEREKYGGHQVFGGAFSIGYVGVDIFFVLSGFIIVAAHYRDLGVPSAASRYFARRFIRLYPIYWIYLAAAIALGVVTGVAADWLKPAELATAFTLVRISHEAPPISVAWSLYHEVLFYAAFAVAIWNKRIGIALFLAWMAAVVAAYFSGFTAPFLKHQDLVGVITSLFNLNFAMGILVYLAATRGTIRPLWSDAGALLCLVTGAALAYRSGAEDYRILFGVGAAFLLLSCVSREQRGGANVSAWLVFLGDASYSIYLIHPLVLSAFAKVSNALQLPGKVPAEGQFVIAAITAVAAGCIAYVLIEKPLLARLSKRAAPARPATNSAPDPQPAPIAE
jgi:peptidoglycan/LPS O-acetylase OafA/YrhL